MCRKMTEIVEREGFLGNEQYGFRAGRSTTDAIFVLSTMLRKAKIRKKKYACAFVDITKVNKIGIDQNVTLKLYLLS